MAFAPDANTLRKITSGTWFNEPPKSWHLQRVDRIDIALRRQNISDGLLLYSRNPKRDLERLKSSKIDLKRVVLLTDATQFQEVQAISHLLVADLNVALRAIGSGARDAFQGKVVAITGSVGKTTTKNLLAHTLAEHFSLYAKLDNQNGFKYTLNRLLELNNEDVAIFEVARIALPEASFLLKPDVSVITAVAEAHMSALDSLENTATVKASIVRGMPPNGTAIINADTNFADTLISTAQDHGCRVLTYSAEGRGDINLQSYDPSSRTVQAAVGGETVQYTLNLLGKHNALNSLGVLAVVESLGGSVQDHLPALETFMPVHARGTSIETNIAGRSVLLIDDSYNANPTSMIASLRGFKDNFSDRRRVLILGDMLELGPREESFHEKLAEEVLRVDAARIYLVGPLMRNLWKQLPDSAHVSHVAAPESLLRLVPKEVKDGDVVLLKASNGTGLGTLVGEWTAPPRPPASWRLTIAGSVQGTGYRRWLRRLAAAHEVDGWVRNRSDGRVESLVHGDRMAISELIAQLHEGPSSAEVTRVTINSTTARPRPGFRVRKDRVVQSPVTRAEPLASRLARDGKKWVGSLIRKSGLRK